MAYTIDKIKFDSIDEDDNINRKKLSSSSQEHLKILLPKGSEIIFEDDDMITYELEGECHIITLGEENVPHILDMCKTKNVDKKRKR